MIDLAIETVQNVARQTFWPAARSAAHAVEMPFVTGDPAVLRIGVIDLAFQTSEGWQIIDYKTDRALDDKRYAAQLDAYRLALASVGCLVAGASLVSVRSDPA